MARRHRGTADDQPVMEIAAGGTFETEVRGESHYQNAIAACVDASVVEQSSDLACQAEFEARLVREPENRHDANAVAVTSVGARTLGHLPRELAIVFAPTLDRIGALAAVQCRARAYGAGIIRRARGISGSGWICLTRPTSPRRSASSTATRSRRWGNREDWSASVTRTQAR